MKNIEAFDPVVDLYLAGASLNQICALTGVSMSTAWRRVKKAGVNRSASEGVRLAIAQGRGAARLKGRARYIDPDTRARMTAAANVVKRAKARGWRINSNGYYEFTIGEHAGRSLHVVLMEKRIGRRLLPDEIVHHIDGDKLNNDENNLALVTASGHARLHRYQDSLAGNARQRSSNGQFNKEDTTCAQ